MIHIINAINYISDLTGADIAQLPTNNGLVMQVAPSSNGTQYFDMTSSDNVSLLFLCKNTSQQTALENLNSICTTLTRTRHDTQKIYNLTVATSPNYVDKDGDYWIYSCVVTFKYFNEVGKYE